MLANIPHLTNQRCNPGDCVDVTTGCLFTGRGAQDQAFEGQALEFKPHALGFVIQVDKSLNPSNTKLLILAEGVIGWAWLIHVKVL